MTTKVPNMYYDTYNDNPMYINGFNKIQTAKQVTNITSETRIDEFKYTHSSSDYDFLDSSYMDLTHKLVHEMIKNNLVNFTQHKDVMSGDHVIRANLNAVKCEQQFVNLEEQSFIVDGNKFTNEELIEAVRHTYPEKFI